MIAIIIPVHNEEEVLPACLNSCSLASTDPALRGEKVERIVVLDACSDSSADIAKAHGATIVLSNSKNVGKARALGATNAIHQGARWLAFTDGDSEVPPDWISRQLAWEADAVCGIVSVKDWSPHSSIVQHRYVQHYKFRDGHRHIHGANLGIRADVYLQVGGFLPMAVHEDVELIRALENAGASIAWVAQPCVLTSGRSVGRLLGGFACYLRQLETPSEKKTSDKASLMVSDKVRLSKLHS